MMMSNNAAPEIINTGCSRSTAEECFFSAQFFKCAERVSTVVIWPDSTRAADAGSIEISVIVRVVTSPVAFSLPGQKHKDKHAIIMQKAVFFIARSFSN